METILDLDKFRSGCHPSRKPGFYYSSSCAGHKSLLLRTMCPFVPEGSAGCSARNGFLAPEAAWLKHLAGVPEMCVSALRQRQARALWSLSAGLWPALGASSWQTLGPDTIFSCGPPATEAPVLQLPGGPASALSNTVMLSIKEQKFVKSLSGTGFPEAQRIPAGHFQRSLSVVTAPDGSSRGTQILLESECFLCRRMVEMSFWSLIASFCLSWKQSVVQ